MPSGTNVGTAVVSVVPSMQGFSKAVSGNIKSAFDKASGVAQKEGADAGKKFASALGGNSKSGFSQLASSFKTLNSEVATQAKNMGAAIGQAFKTVGTAIANTSGVKKLQDGLNSIKAKATDAFETVKLKAAFAFDGMYTKALNATSGIRSGFSKLTSAIGGAFSSVASKASAPFATMAGKIAAGFATVSTAVSAKLSPIVSKAQSIFSGVVSTAKSALSPVVSAATSAISPLGSALKGVGESAANLFTSALGTIAEKVGPVLSNVATAVTKGLGIVAGVAGTAFAAVTASALSGFADYEQLVGGVNKIFGDASNTVQQYAANAYKTAGVSANQYMTQVTSFSASLISSLGGDTAQAADLANTAMVSMADNVNTYGSNMEDVQNAFAGFAKSNFTMLDNLKLGYGGTQSEMKRLIADSAALTKEQEELGLSVDSSSMSFDNIVKAIAVMQKHMGIAGTTANEAMGTISGSIGMAKAAWSDFMTGLGRDDADFSVLTQNLLDSIGAVATNVAPRVATIGANIIAAFPTALAGLGNILAPIIADALSSAYSIAQQSLASIGFTLPGLDSETILASMGQLATGIQTAFQQLVTAIQPAMQPLMNMVQSMVGFIQALLPPLMNLAQAVLPLIAPVISIIANSLSALYTFLAPVVADVINFATQLLTIAQPAIQAFADVLQGVLPAAIQVLSGIWNATFPVLSAVVTSVFSVVSSVVQSAMSVIQAVISTVTAAISGDWDGVWNGVLSIFSTIWDGLVSAAQAGIDGVSNVVSTVKGVVTDIFAGAGQWLVSSGQALLQGFCDGVTSVVDSVAGTIGGALSTIRSLFPFSPAKKGPFSGHGYTTYSGKALITDFGKGITKNASAPINAIKDTMAAMNAEMFSTGSSLSANVGGRYARNSASSGNTTNIYQNTKVVRSDADLYSAATILNGNMLRLAGV